MRAIEAVISLEMSSRIYVMRWNLRIYDLIGSRLLYLKPVFKFVHWISNVFAFPDIKDKNSPIRSENFRMRYILNPDYLIWVSNEHTFDFLFKQLFLGFLVYSREKSNRFFKFESPYRFCILILYDAHNFRFIGFIYATLIEYTSTRLG